VPVITDAAQIRADLCAADRLGRDFTAEQPGQRLVGDITYLKTGKG
jgi:putative transposase